MPSKWERRIQSRVDLKVFVTTIILDDKIYLCRSGNISRGGIRLTRTINSPCEPGQKVWLEFCLPNEEDNICALGRITHRDAASFGAQFIHFCQDGEKKVTDYIVRETIAAQ